MTLKVATATGCEGEKGIKCPDYWGACGLISGMNLYYKLYFGTFQSGQNTGVAIFQGS